MSISDYYEKKLLEKLKALSEESKVFVKLHTGDPGEAGTNNEAAEKTRKKVVLQEENPLKNNAALEWTAVSKTETYKYVSLWDKETEGNCLWSGPLEKEKAMTEGDTFTLPKEKLEVALD